MPPGTVRKQKGAPVKAPLIAGYVSTAQNFAVRVSMTFCGAWKKYWSVL